MGVNIGEATLDFLALSIKLYFLWILTVCILAATGINFGARSTFIKVLLIVFDWGKQRIEQHEQQKSDAETEGATAGGGGSLTRNSSSSSLHRSGSGTKLHSRSNSIGSKDEFDLDDSPDGNHVIERDVVISTDGFQVQDYEDLRHQFQLSDVMFFCKNGIEAIIEDEVTQRFSAAELPSWNLLTRTNNIPEFISYRLAILYYLGWFLRYVILFPFRASLAIVAVFTLLGGTTLIGPMPDGRVKRWCYTAISKTSFRLFMRSFSAVLTFHDKENRPKNGSICVANHTSPVDIVCLGCDYSYAMVGQAQPGFIKLIQDATHRAAAQVWFQRSEAKDRMAVARRLREHCEDKNNLPVLIFPEGTCINNTSIMMFKKGSFEVGATIYPVAIKYDPRFADPFWNSSKQSFIQHIILIMTSWSLVVDVWYLPPQRQREGEDAIQFSQRIKSLIAKKGGLVELDWDGGLKRSKPKEALMKIQQSQYSNTLIDLQQSPPITITATPSSHTTTEQPGSTDGSDNREAAITTETTTTTTAAAVTTTITSDEKVEEKECDNKTLEESLSSTTTIESLISAATTITTESTTVVNRTVTVETLTTTSQEEGTSSTTKVVEVETSEREEDTASSKTKEE